LATRPLRLTSVGPGLVALGALLSALLVGALTAADVPLGIGLLMGLCYAPLVLLNLPVGIALWVALVFIESLPAVSIGPNAAAVLIAIAWVGTLRSRGEWISGVLRAHRPLLATCALLLVWLSTSVLWAEEPAATGEDVWQWYVAVLTLIIVATTISTPGQMRLVLAAFVVGAGLSVAIGLLGGGLSSSATAVDTATASEGRLQGGGGDPNYLAAGLVPAIAFASALLSTTRDPVARWTLAITIGLLGVGLAATQSRGGLVAALVALAAALLIYRRRLVSLAVLAVLAIAVASWFATSPGAWDRVTTDYDGGGTGRTELWDVGWQIFEEHPVTGIGLNNFRNESNRYVRRPGNLEFVELIAERPQVVHNAYLQVLVEAGVIGLVLFLALLLACLRAAWVAAKRFEALGQRRLAELARAVLVAGIGMMAAAFFLSNTTDRRWWVLLALGPAMLAMARRAARRAELQIAAR
jgi:O-antigen ligase